MNWGSWGEFFSMGGYGLYVWGSYIVTLGMMAGEIAMLATRKRALLQAGAAGGGRGGER